MNKKLVIGISSVVFLIAVVLGAFMTIPVLSASSWTAKAKEQVKLLVDEDDKIKGAFNDVSETRSGLEDARKKVQAVYDIAETAEKKIGDSVGIGGIDITSQYAKAEKQQKELKRALGEYKESVSAFLFATEAGVELLELRNMNSRTPAGMKESAKKLKEAGEKIVKYGEERDVSFGKRLGKSVGDLGETMEKASDAYASRNASALRDAQRELLSVNTRITKEVADYRKEIEQYKDQLEDARKDLKDIKKELDS